MPPVDRVLQLLEAFKKSKEMIVHPVDVHTVQTFLTGFRSGCAACGLEVPRKLQWQVLEGRGWKRAAAGPVGQMKEKGMADPAIIDELIDIEIEQLQRLPK